MSQEIEALNLDINRLQAQRNDIVNAKFLGGGFGLFLFLFISMGIGFFFIIFSAINKNNTIRQLDAELLILRHRLAAKNADIVQSQQPSVKVKSI